MSQAPSMPMYWDAYLADTTHLSTEEHGAYLLLLAAMWRRNGSVPDDDADNARIIGLSKAKWKKVKARLSGFLVMENGTISQKKLQKTWEKTQEKIQKNRANGAKGGRPKSSENSDLAKPNGSVSVKPDQSIPEPEPEPIREIGKPISCPFSEFWSHWPNKIAKAAAEKAWGKLSQPDRLAARGAVADGWFNRWRQSQPDANAIHPASFLNSKRWNDEFPQFTQTTGGRNAQPASNRPDRVQRVITAAADSAPRKDWG